MAQHLDLNTHCRQGIYDVEDVCFITLKLLNSEGTLAAPENFLLLGRPKDAYIHHASVKVRVKTCVEKCSTYVIYYYLLSIWMLHGLLYESWVESADLGQPKMYYGGVGV